MLSPGLLSKSKHIASTIPPTEDEHAAIGSAFEKYLEAHDIVSKDHVIDIAITPNRPDAISHVGVARDVAALSKKSLKRPALALPADGGEAANQISVEIEESQGCRRYVGMVVRGVTVKESPAWMKQRLTAIGLRPRNNIVDITNYVMFECGQPLHAFDYDQVAGQKIIVRHSKPKEKFLTSNLIVIKGMQRLTIKSVSCLKTR